MIQIEMVAIADMQAYENNPKLHPKHQVELLKASITEYGWTTPVLLDKDNVVIAGHGRLEAALHLGMTEAPAVRLEHLTPEQAKVYRIADNRLTEMGGWDEHLLAAELEELISTDFDTDLTGFAEEEVGKLLEPETEDGETPEPPAEPVSKAGDVWVLGKHRLICGDSTDADTVARVLDGAKPNLMVTDPPYGVEYDPEWRLHAGKNTPGGSYQTVTQDDRAGWGEAWVHCPSGVIYCWHAGIHSGVVYKSFVKAGFEIRGQIIWVKNESPLSRGHYHQKHEPCVYAVRKGNQAQWIGGRKQHTVWDIPKSRVNETGHSTQKPLECMARPIRNHKGDVYDPFLGSGTTLIAAENLRRRCFGVEIDPAYCDVIVERWQNHTGQKAKREKD